MSGTTYQELLTNSPASTPQPTDIVALGQGAALAGTTLSQLGAAIAPTLHTPAAPGQFMATPATGSAAVPSLRAIAASDLPGATMTVAGTVTFGQILQAVGSQAITPSAPAATVYAGPVSGPAAVAAPRALVGTDLPVATTTAAGAVKIGTGLSIDGTGLLTATGGSTPTAPAAFVLAGPVTGAAAPAAARALVGSDLPTATTSVQGAVIFGSTGGTAADGGVVAGHTASIAANAAAITSVTTTANAAQPKVPAAAGSLMGGPSALGGALAAITVAAGLTLAAGSLAVAYGTGANQALQGSLYGAANGVATLDATGNVTANRLIPTSSGAAAISLGDYTGNLALAGNAYLINTLALNNSLATQAVGMANITVVLPNTNTDDQLTANITAVAGNALITNFAHGIGTGSILTGTRNTFWGYGAGNAMGTAQSSIENTFGGFGSGNAFGSMNIGSSGYNTFYGSKTGYHMVNGQFNVLNGQGAGSALQNNAVGNVCLGHGTISGFDYGVINPATGILNVGYVPANGTTGNTCVGTYAGQTITSAAYNFLGGYGAGQFLTSGAYNTFSGRAAGNYITTGQYNVASGAFALSATGNGVSNVVAIGHGTLLNTQTNQHTVVGNQAAQAAIGALRITGFGAEVVQNLIDGNDVVGIGDSAGQNLVHANQSIYIGSGTGSQGVVGGVGYISDGGGVNAGNTLTITSVGTKNAGYQVGDLISGTGFTSCTITAVLTGTNGPGTYTVSGAAQLVAAGTGFNNRDFSNTIAVGYNVEPTASNQAIFGNGAVTSFSVAGPPGGSLMYLNSAYQIAIGKGALGATTLAPGSVQHAIAIGYNSCHSLTTGDAVVGVGQNTFGAMTTNGNCAAVGYLGYANATGGGHAGIGANVAAGIIAATGTAIIGNGAQAIGDFGNICVIGSGASATAAGQIVIGYNVTAASTGTGVTIGSASQSVSIGGAFTIAGGATGAAVHGGTVAATGGFLGNATATAPAAGVIGELQTVTIPAGTPIALTTATATNATNKTLTAGIWLISANVLFNPSAAPTALQAWIGTTLTPAVPTGTGGAGYSKLALAFTSGAVQAIPIASYYLQVTPAMVSGGTNIVYLSCYAAFASGTCNVTGTLNATRVG